MTFRATIHRPREPAYSIQLDARDSLEAAQEVTGALKAFGVWDDKVRVRIVALAGPEIGSSEPFQNRTCQNGHTPSDLYTVAGILAISEGTLDK